MKKIMKFVGAFFFASVLLTSCGEVNVEDLDKDIETEEDIVDAMITIDKASMEIINKALGPLQELKDLTERVEDIKDASEDINDAMSDEDWTMEDLEDAENWDEYEDVEKELEELEKELKKATPEWM
jgi:DNA repair exonuclease SbcCD ATPase subunit